MGGGVFTKVFAFRTLRHGMVTTKTKTIAVRVPIDTAKALEDDAEELNSTPGKILRQMLEGRYSAPRTSRKSVDTARNEEHAEALPADKELPELT